MPGKGHPSKGTHYTETRLCRRLGIVLEELAVSSEELTLIGRDLELVKDRVHRTDRFAVRTIDAGPSVDVVHLLLIVGGDATDGTDL